MGYDVSFHPISPEEMREWYFTPLTWIQQGQEKKVLIFATQHGMEDFYAGARDADYIIYNSTIDGELKSLDELLKKSELLKDFKAVKEGNVWCLTKSMFQETTCLGDVIMDIHRMLTENDPDGLTYLYRLE